MPEIIDKYFSCAPRKAPSTQILKIPFRNEGETKTFSYGKTKRIYYRHNYHEIRAKESSLNRKEMCGKKESWNTGMKKEQSKQNTGK